jgi:serine/threonine protein kinase
MEYLAGGSLQRADPAAVAGPARPRGRRRARALSALHLAGIVHAAVKPANVLIDPVRGQAR